jgi:hypothetical protein
MDVLLEPLNMYSVKRHTMHIKGLPVTGVLLVHDDESLFIVFKGVAAVYSGCQVENTPQGKWYNVAYTPIEATKVLRWMGQGWQKVPKSTLNREFVQDCRDVHKGGGVLKIDQTNSSAPMFAATKKLPPQAQHYVGLTTAQYVDFREKARKLRSLVRKMWHLIYADGAIAPTLTPLAVAINPVADTLLEELAHIDPKLVQTPEIYEIFQARMKELQGIRKSVLAQINQATTTTRDYCHAA